MFLFASAGYMQQLLEDAELVTNCAALHAFLTLTPPVETPPSALREPALPDATLSSYLATPRSLRQAPLLS